MSSCAKMATVSAQKTLSHASISPSTPPCRSRALPTCRRPPPLAGAEAAEHENYENLRSQLSTFRANHAVAAAALLPLTMDAHAANVIPASRCVSALLISRPSMPRASPPCARAPHLWTFCSLQLASQVTTLILCCVAYPCARTSRPTGSGESGRPRQHHARSRRPQEHERGLRPRARRA